MSAEDTMSGLDEAPSAPQTDPGVLTSRCIADRGSKRRKRGTTAAGSSGAELDKAGYPSKKTTETYEGHIARLRAFCNDNQQGDDNPPGEFHGAIDTLSEATARALYAYASWQVDVRGLKYASVDGARSAVKRYFEDRFGCAGDGWHIETDAAGKVIHSGNPVNYPPYLELWMGMKERSKREDDVVQSLPWLYPEQERLLAYLETPDAQGAFTEATREMFRAYMTLSFYCGTKTDEMRSLTWSALVMDQETLTSKTPYHELHLTLRNSRENDSPDVKVYQLHSNADEPALDPYETLRRWRNFWNRHAGSVKLHDSHYLFPAYSKKGDFKVGEPMTDTWFNNVFREMVEKGKLLDIGKRGKFTRHCTRIGCGEHRFLHAKKRWSLNAIKWWLGLTRDELVNTLTQYLLEESEREEHYFGDIMNPDTSSRGGLLQTGEEDDEIVRLKDLRQFRDEIRKTIQDTHKSSHDSIVEALKLSETSLHNTVESQMRNHEQTMIRLFNEQTALLNEMRSYLKASADGNVMPVVSQEVPPVSDESRPIRDAVSRQTQALEESSSSPQPSMKPPHIPPVQDLEESIDQWENANVSRGHQWPLKIWPASWQRGNQTYSNRKLLYEAYIRADSNLATLSTQLGLHPEKDGLKAHLDKIRARGQEEGRIKKRKSGQHVASS